MTREAIGKKLRFEVFKRDKFACQYCGAKAPDVVLHADHMQPVAEGGETTLMNLITACQACNSGKGARLLSDGSVVERQRAQLAELEERRQQLEMMLEWRNGLAELDDDNAMAIAQYFCGCVGWKGLSDYGHGQVRDWLKKLKPTDLMQAIDAAVRQYTVNGADGFVTEESARKAFHMVPRIAKVMAGSTDKPHLKDLLYVRGILRNRFDLEAWEGKAALNEIEYAFNQGVSVEALKRAAKDCDDMDDFSVILGVLATRDR